MNILTWNIQATKGCDGIFSTSRIVDQIKTFGELDIICLQEVARHIPSLNSEDQTTLVSNAFPDLTPIWAPGFSVPDAAGNRSEFGNLTLVKPALYKNSRVHILPSPSISEPQIPRTMAEVVIGTPNFEVAIFNTHLAFHSRPERIAQLQNLTHLRNQITDKSYAPTTSNGSGPFLYKDDIQAVLLCGDLNVGSETVEFKENIIDQGWIDCWESQSAVSAGAKQTRQPTCGVFDDVQWSDGPDIRDYFLATDNIAHQTYRVTVDVNTNASDHQPVLLEIDL